MTAARASSLRTLVIALTAFFTVVDLFATQAILPLLAHSYRVTPAAMSVAVNASTLGMAIAGLGVALFSRHLPRRAGIVVALVLLAVPTTLLAYAPGLHVFALLRIAQGLCMSTAFTLTLGYLGENCSAEDQAGAFAAYITGNVGGHDAGRRGHLLRAGHRDRLRQPRPTVQPRAASISPPISPAGSRAPRCLAWRISIGAGPRVSPALPWRSAWPHCLTARLGRKPSARANSRAGNRVRGPPKPVWPRGRGAWAT